MACRVSEAQCQSAERFPCSTLCRLVERVWPVGKSWMRTTIPIEHSHHADANRSRPPPFGVPLGLEIQLANRYGEAALMAVRMETYGKTPSPAERWDDAVKKLYPTTPAGQKKSAPRLAFLGLCEAGLVKGIHGDAFASTSNRNKACAVEAVKLLAAGTHTTVSQLWAAVTAGEELQHASQMDVVLALWKNGLILAPA